VNAPLFELPRWSVTVAPGRVVRGLAPRLGLGELDHLPRITDSDGNRIGTVEPFDDRSPATKLLGLGLDLAGFGSAAGDANRRVLDGEGRPLLVLRVRHGRVSVTRPDGALVGHVHNEARHGARATDIRFYAPRPQKRFGIARFDDPLATLESDQLRRPFTWRVERGEKAVGEIAGPAEDNRILADLRLPLDEPLHTLLVAFVCAAIDIDWIEPPVLRGAN
jgi:hypothetical protein